MMPITLDEVGISLMTSPPSLLQEVEVEATVEETEPYVKYDGTLDTTAGHTFGLKNEIKLKGIGDFPTALALATDGDIDHELITGGVTLIKRIKTGESSDKASDWEADATNYPEAGADASSSE